MGEYLSFKEEMSNESEIMAKEFQEINAFVQKYFHLVVVSDRVRLTSQILEVLLKHVRVKICY